MINITPNPNPEEKKEDIITVCLNCGHIWPTHAERPQCHKCRRTATRPATDEEIARYRAGTTQPKNNSGSTPGEDDQQPSNQVDPNVDLESLIDPSSSTPATTPTPEEETPTPRKGIGIAAALGTLAILVIAGYYLVSRRTKQEAENSYYLEDETPTGTTYSSAPAGV